MKIDEMLMKALASYDNNRERSQQEQIGVSQLGGCRKQVWLQLNKAEKTNQNTLRLPALMGTAIHKMIEESLTKESWGEYWLEEELEYDGIKGHVDLYIPEIGAVVDWKTTKLKNLDYFPSKQQRWQVHVYAWLIQKAGNATPKTVTLVAIPRDGDERQIKIHTEEYNEQIALEAVAWFRDIQSRDTAPEPERYAAQFCQHYCPYFGDNCGGKGKEFTGEIIEDNKIISAVKRYLELDSQIKDLTSQKDGVKATLENVSGITPDGIKVSWSQVNGRTSIDENEVKKLLGYVPTKQGDASMRLSVKQ